MRTVLFVCTGNTCRSPMAEAVAQHLFRGGLLGDGAAFLAVSAGVMASSGEPPSPETIAALKTLGIEHDGRSKPVTRDMIREAEAVVCMTRSHVDAVRELLEGDSGPRIETVLGDEDLADPIGQGQADYDQLAQKLLQVLPDLLRRVFEHEPHEDRSRV